MSQRMHEISNMEFRGTPEEIPRIPEETFRRGIKMRKSKETSEEEFREEFRGGIYMKQVSEFRVQIQRRHSDKGFRWKFDHTLCGSL